MDGPFRSGPGHSMSTGRAQSFPAYVKVSMLHELLAVRKAYIHATVFN